MKRLLLLLFTMCLSSMLWAKDYLLVIDFTDGTEMTFALAKQPVITFADHIIRVKVGSRSSEFEMSDVANFHFKEDVSDILLVIAFTDGTEIKFALAQQPVITIAGQTIHVKVGSRSSDLEMSDVVNFHFKEDVSDNLSLHIDEDFTISWQGEDLIVITNATPDAVIRLYGLNGMPYPSRVNTNGDRIEISLSALPKNVYLLNINNSRTLKIYRK